MTGGAPELNPRIFELIEFFSVARPRVMFRSNLSVIAAGDCGPLLEALVGAGAVRA